MIVLVFYLIIWQRPGKFRGHRGPAEGVGMETRATEGQSFIMSAKMTAPPSASTLTLRDPLSVRKSTEFFVVAPVS